MGLLWLVSIFSFQTLKIWGLFIQTFRAGKFLNSRKSNSIYLKSTVAAAAKSLQSCPTLCYPTVGSPPGSPVHGILQARTLEWVTISFSIAWKWKVKVKLLSRLWLLATPWTAAYPGSPHPWDFLGKSTGVAYYCLLRKSTVVSYNKTTVTWQQINCQVGLKALSKTWEKSKCFQIMPPLWGWIPCQWG